MKSLFQPGLGIFLPSPLSSASRITCENYHYNLIHPTEGGGTPIGFFDNAIEFKVYKFTTERNLFVISCSGDVALFTFVSLS